MNPLPSLSELFPVLVLLSFHAGATFAAPVSFNSAMPVAEGDFIMRLTTTTLRASGDPSPRNRDLTVHSTSIVGAYGWNPDAAMILVIPYLDKQQSQSSWSSPRGDVGFGDVRGLLRYTVFRDNYPRGQTALAPFVGIKAATGEHRKDGLPRPLQLGSGSWDPLVGITFQNTSLSRSHFAALSYQNTTRADGFEFGDRLRMDYAFQQVVWKHRPDDAPSAYLYGLLEANYRWEDKHENRGVQLDNSGGSTLYLTPGLQYVTRRWVMETSLQWPVLQDLNGNALEDEFTLTVGFRWNY